MQKVPLKLVRVSWIRRSRGFIQHNMEPPSKASDAQEFSKIDFHLGKYEETINYRLSNQSLYLLDRLAELEIYGEKSALAS
jgi:hypothetical protein